MGCTASHPATVDDGIEAHHTPRDSKLAAKLSSKKAIRDAVKGKSAGPQQKSVARVSRAVKPHLPATPENLPENHGSIPELQLSLDSTGSHSSHVGTSVALGHTGLSRSTGGSDALSRSTASTIGAKSQVSDTSTSRSLLLSGPHRLSQASNLDADRLSFDTRKTEHSTSSLEADTVASPTTMHSSTSDLATPATPRGPGNSLWRSVIVNSSAMPVARSTSQVSFSPQAAATSPKGGSAATGGLATSMFEGVERSTKSAPAFRMPGVDFMQTASEGMRDADQQESGPTSRPALFLDIRTRSGSLDLDPTSARGGARNILYNINSNMYHRPTYERDAVDDEYAAANGVSLPRFIPRQTVPSALPGQQAPDKPGNNGSFQAYSTEGGALASNSIIMDAHMNDLGCMSPVGSPLPEAHMGSLTGWQAIAAQIMEEGDDDVERLAAELDYNTNGTDASVDTPHVNTPPSRPKARYGSMAMESPKGREPNSPKTPRFAEGVSTPKTPRNRAQYGSIVDIARRQQQGRPVAAAAPAVQIAFQPGGGFYVQYACLEKLGAGAFGEAVKARRRKDGQMFVVKMMHSKSMTDKAKEEARNEVHVLATLNHPNIVKYYESFLDNHDGRLLIVMELCEEGDLDVMLKKRAGNFMSEDEIMMKFVQICLGLLHVHNKGIIHRDLKTNNIFCCANGIVKLGDFGISKMLTGGEKIARTMVGTPYYMSPEIIKGRKYDAKTDVWAIGCVLYELCALRKAFDATNLAAITVKVMSGKIPPIPDQYSSDIKDLIHKLIQKKPDARPELVDVLGLAFVRKHLVAYEKHILKHVNVNQRESFVASVAQYMPELAQEQAQLLADSMPLGELSAASSLALDVVRREVSEASTDASRNNSAALPEEGTRGRSLELPSRKQSATDKSSVRKEDLDAMMRELRAREEAASREKLRAFKAQRPRAKSKTMELLGEHNSASVTHLLNLSEQGSAGSIPSPDQPRIGAWAPPLPPSSASAAQASADQPVVSDTLPDAAPLRTPFASKPRISQRSAGTLLGDIKAILQQPEIDRLEVLSEENSVMGEPSFADGDVEESQTSYTSAQATSNGIGDPADKPVPY